jgi:hypothetical protein
MKTSLVAAILIVALSSCACASGAFVFGRTSYRGDACSDCNSDPETANFYGLAYHVHTLPVVDLVASIEYAASDVNYGCSGLTGTADFSHISLNAAGTVTLVRFVVVRAYGGVGLSYNWFNFGHLDCQAQLELDTTPGYHGVIGLETTSPGVPLRTYLEGRLSRIGSSPHMTTQSIYLGFEIGI